VGIVTSIGKWLALGCVFWLQASAREWSDASGKFRVQAELVSVRGDKVVLEKKDGSIIAVPIDKLCQADRDFIKQHLAKETAKPTAEAPTPSTTPSAKPSPATDSKATVGVPSPLSADAATLAEQTQAILRKCCYRCHGEEGSSEGGFNFVINLEKLSKTLAKPGESASSLLFHRMTTKDDTLMPPVGEEPRPTTDELATIAAWIKAGSPAIPSKLKRKYIANEQIVRAIESDIAQQAERSRRFMRYFTLTHLYNAGVSEEELQTYRNAFTKLINSLSWNTDLLTPRPIDTERTVMAIDIRELHWNVEMWQSIEAANPYFLKLTTPSAIACAEAAQTEMPYIRIDWFVFAASKPPLYHVLLNLPDTDAGLEDLLRVKVQANIDQEQAIRAAFNRSGVSQNNRLIEWHKSPYGSYWKSYDFGGSSGKQNLFQYPMGPHGKGETFKHDGGEIIFSLPNGLQGYLLVDGEGSRIDQGPTNIVSDPKRPDKTVTNGVSCMSCHYTGVIAKKDEVGDAVRANKSAFSDASDILALYRESSELDQIFAKDGKRFANALRQLGITSLSRSGEPVSAMAANFDQEIELNQVACEFGLSSEDFRTRLSKATTVSRAFSSLLIPGGTIKRDVFKSMFGEAAIDLRLTTESVERRADRKDSNAAARNASPRNAPNMASPKSNGKSGADDTQIASFSDLRWGVKSLAFAPSGKFLAAGRMDRAVNLFDIPNQSQAGSIEKIDVLRDASQCVFTPNGKNLIVGGGSGLILVYSVSDEGMLKQVGQFVGHSKEISALIISSDGRFALSGAEDKKACYWEIATGKEVASFNGFEGKVKAVHMGRAGKILQATDGALLLEFDTAKKEIKRRRQLTNSWAAGQSAAFSADGETVAAGDSYNIRVWNVTNGRKLRPLVSNEIQWTIVFTPDGNRLLSGGNALVNVWDVKKGQRVHAQSMAGTGYVQSLAVAQDSQSFAATGSSNRNVQVFRLPK
jgi:WD40 repeat protein